MSKFCGNCGAVADDNAMVCGNCGTPFAPVQPTYQAPVQPTYQAPTQQAYQPPVQPGYNPMPGAPAMNQNIPGVTNNGTKKNGFIPKIIAAVLAVVILVVGVVAIIGNKSKSDYETVIKEFAHAIETGNGKKLAKKLYKDAYTDEEDIMEFFDEINEELCEEFDSKKIKTSYKITEEREISKSDMEDMLDVRKAGLTVFFDLTVKAGGDKDTYIGYIVFIKDGGWKIIDMDINY